MTSEDGGSYTERLTDFCNREITKYVSDSLYPEGPPLSELEVGLGRPASCGCAVLSVM